MTSLVSYLLLACMVEVIAVAIGIVTLEMSPLDSLKFLVMFKSVMNCLVTQSVSQLKAKALLKDSLFCYRLCSECLNYME